MRIVVYLGYGLTRALNEDRLNSSHAFKFDNIRRREQSDKTLCKMKKIKFLASLLAMALCVSFTSCGDDEENNGENAGTGNVFPEGTKKLASISDSYETATFTYDGSKLVSVKEGNDQTITFVYTGNTVVMTSVYRHSNNGTTEEEKDIYTLNIGTNGFATSGTVKLIDNDGSENKGSFAFKYDGDRLTEIAVTGDYGYDNYKLTWKDGNITNVVNEYQEDNYPVKTNTNTSTYDTELNTAGLSFFEEVGTDVDELEYAYYAGLLGKSTKNLLKSTDDGDGYVYSYTYELSTNNYPTKISESYSYNGGSSSSSSRTLTYK